MGWMCEINAHIYIHIYIHTRARENMKAVFSTFPGSLLICICTGGRMGWMCEREEEEGMCVFL